jgi:hypothetical protein
MDRGDEGNMAGEFAEDKGRKRFLGLALFGWAAVRRPLEGLIGV